MALKIWTGAALDGNWATAGNWSPSAPAAGDDVLFQNSSQSVTTGLGPALTGANYLNSLVIETSYTGFIGSGSGALVVDCEYLLVRGSGSAYWLDVGKGDGAALDVIVDAPNNADVQLVCASETVADAYFLRGRITTSATTTYTRMTVGYMTNEFNDAQVTLTSGGTYTTIWQRGGRITANGAFTTLIQGGGLFNHTAGAATTVHLLNGTYLYNSTGTLSRVQAVGGYFDASGVANARTITASAFVHPCRVNLKGSNITFTAAPVLVGVNPEVELGYRVTAAKP